MKLPVLAALGLIAAPATAQDDFDWRREPSRLMINGALSNWASACAREFGFTHVSQQPPAIMQARIEAHLLLAGYRAESELLDWSRLITSWTNTDASEERGADALLAALADPDSYARAEALYLESVLGAFRTFFEACERGTRIEFIRSNYLTGAGMMPNVEARLREEFRDSIEQLRSEQR